MDPRWRLPYGLRPTLRQVMIVVVFVAVATALFRGAPPLVLSVLVPLTPPLLALLVALFDRPGPAKFWLAGLIASLFPPALAAWCDLWVWWYGGDQASVALALIVVNGLGLVGLVRVTRRLPRPCPGCGMRSLLPLGRRAR